MITELFVGDVAADVLDSKSDNSIEVAVGNWSRIVELELSFLWLAKDTVLPEHYFTVNGEAYATFGDALAAARKPKQGRSRGEAWVVWETKESAGEPNSGYIYIGDTEAQAAHAYFMWYGNEVIKPEQASRFGVDPDAPNYSSAQYPHASNSSIRDTWNK